MFGETMNPAALERGVQSLCDMFETDSLEGKTLIDIVPAAGSSRLRHGCSARKSRRSITPAELPAVDSPVAMLRAFARADAGARAVPRSPLKEWKEYGRERGMSPRHDVVDWVGGLPFEVAKPELIFDFYRARGFQMTRLKSCAGGRGCNEFVFKR